LQPISFKPDRLLDTTFELLGPSSVFFTQQTHFYGLSSYNTKEKIMREQMQTRLEALRKEIEIGQAELEKVESQRTYLRETMLRISGAITVLEELLADQEELTAGGEASGDKKPPAGGQANETDAGLLERKP
jgi:hypothetical protein